MNLTIADGATESGILDLRDAGGLAVRDLTFDVPAHGVSVKVLFSATPAGTFKVLNDGFGNDYALQPSTFQVLPGIKAGALKLVAGSVVTGDQVFGVNW
jgi:hypothetical protein